MAADLEQKIPTNKRLHNIFPSKYNTTCRICQKENESAKHLWVECEHNGSCGWEWWAQENPSRDMVTRKSTEYDIITEDQASGCTDSQWNWTSNARHLDNHWNCIKQQKEWSDQAAYNMYESIINPTNDRTFQPKENKSCNGWITIVQAGTTRGVHACVWKICRCYQCPNKEGFPGGRPSTDFWTGESFPEHFWPKMKQRDHIDWLLAPWRDLTFMKFEVDHIVV